MADRGDGTFATLFAPEAAYRTAPFEEPFRGLAAIAAIWEAGRDGSDEVFTMRSEVIAFEEWPFWPKGTQGGWHEPEASQLVILPNHPAWQPGQAWDCRWRRRGPQVRQERAPAAWINRAKRSLRQALHTPP
ncbi:MAG TPA: hypothetical protein VFH98_01225 [Candidatus Limnocylindria bacterium]|nr:hypothetical protein [Candidatus Limnocylindria bacterium]